MRQFDFINLYRQAVIAKEQGDMARSVTRIAVLLFIPLLLLTAGCQENVGQRKGVAEPAGTVYTQKAAMSIYAYQPERALLIVDSAVIVGNLSEVWADVNRVRIYSQSQMDGQLDSLLGGPKGVRLDTARAIGERLLQHDSLKANHKLRQDVLEMLVYTARQQQDSVRWLQRSRQLVDECRTHGEQTKTLRTEAELAAALCSTGQQQEGMALLDSVIAVLSDRGLTPSFRFNELDAIIIALKRKISILSTSGQYVETLPLARRMAVLLDDYEQHPDHYHDGSYREPQNDTKRADYIRFYRTQADGFITAAYTVLGDEDNMAEAYEKIEKTVRDAVAREHIARYNAMQQQMQRQEAEANAERSQLLTIIFAILLAAGAAAQLWHWRRRRIISQKNRALVRYIEKSLPADEPAHESLPTGEAASASPFAQIHDTILREQLYINPACDRQMLMDRFQLSKERIGYLFAQHSGTKNVSAYINGLRLDHASRLLTSQPDMDIQAIAAACGFSSHRYFSTCFKKRFGLSPTDSRRAKAGE